MHRLALTFLSLALAAGAPVAGSGIPQSQPGTAPAKLQPPMVVELMRKVSDFQADGTGFQDLTGIIHVLQESALKNLAVLVFGYPSDSESIDIDYVRVKKADGSQVLTPPENIQDLSAAITRQAPIYSDIREKHIAVKSLAVGDTLEFHLKRIIRKSEVPGQIWVSVEPPLTDVVREQIDQISLPSDKPYQVISHGRSPEERTEGNRRILQWKHSNAEVQEPPPRAPWAGKPAPSIQLTTFPSWKEVGDWYRDLQEPQTQPGAAVRKKAMELTQGLKSDRERIQAIYAFVSAQIHYVGLSFGIGRYRPHFAEEVLANGYGDCKDKHTLLASLLKSVGVEAWPALIRATGDTDPGAPSPSQFDHLITVIPQGAEWLWLDTTPEVGPFGYLALNLRGKPALVIPRASAAILKTTPETLPFTQTAQYTFTGKLLEGGALEGHSELSLRGDSEMLFRQTFRQVPPNRWQEFLSVMAAPLGLGYEVSSIRPGPLERTDTPFSVTWDLKRKEPSDWEKKRVLIPILPLGIEALLKQNSKPTDPIFLPSPGHEFIYRARLEVPPGLTPPLPPACNLSCPNAEYHASYTFDQGAISVERRMTTRGGTLEGKAREAFNILCQGILSDEDQYIALGGVSAPQAPEDPEAVKWFNEGVEAQQHKDFIIARAAYRKVLERSPKFQGAHANLGLTYLAKGDRQTGIRELQREEDFHPESPFAFQVLGSFYASIGQPDQAISQWKSAVEKDPDNRETFESLLKLLDSEKRYQEGIELLEKALKRDAGNPDDTLALAEFYAHAGQKEKVAPMATKAVDLCDTPEFMTRAARALTTADQCLDQAKAWTDKAAPLLDAQSLLIGSDPQKGLSNTKLLLNVWETKGWILLKQGHAAEAIRFFDAVLSVSLKSSCWDGIVQASERLRRARVTANKREQTSLPPGTDLKDLRRRFTKLTQSQSVAFGKALGGNRKRQEGPHPPADLIALLYTVDFPSPAGHGTLNAVVVVSSKGTEDVLLRDASQDVAPLAQAAKALKLKLRFPDPAPRRLYLDGRILFEKPRSTFVYGMN